MFNNFATPSLADIAAVTGNRNGDGFGDGNGWWAIIIILALFGGFGNGNWGNNGNGCNTGCQNAYDTQAVVQRGFDTQSIISKLDGINSGICSLGYDQLAQMNGITNTVMQTGFGITNAIQADTVANMQNTNALSTQLANCCCENRQGQAELRYTMATDTCAITNAIKDAAQNIMNNDNSNYRQMHDEMVSMQMQAKDDRIAELTAKLNGCDRDNALNNLGTYLVNTLQPTPRPSYQVPNPYTGCCGVNNYNNGCCGQNTCCA